MIKTYPTEVFFIFVGLFEELLYARAGVHSNVRLTPQWTLLLAKALCVCVTCTVSSNRNASVSRRSDRKLTGCVQPCVSASWLRTVPRALHYRGLCASIERAVLYGLVEAGMEIPGYYLPRLRHPVHRGLWRGAARRGKSAWQSRERKVCRNKRKKIKKS